MASASPLSPPSFTCPRPPPTPARPLPASLPRRPAVTGFPRLLKRTRQVTASAVGDVSADGTTYLIGGAIAVALVGTAFPIIFSRKDTCPECDGAGFIRKASATLRANAARKDQAQIVCPRCNGLGKLGQIDNAIVKATEETKQRKGEECCRVNPAGVFGCKEVGGSK